MKRQLTWMMALMALASLPVWARVKLVALPERAVTVIRMDNPRYTLIEEERVLTLQKGLNKVDFSWNGVSIDSDSIRMTVLGHPDGVKLLNVSYPPNEAALVWEIAAEEAYEERVRISYLLMGIDRLVTYTGTADKGETTLDLRSYLVLRNFSGEDFEKALVLLDYGDAYETGILHEETKKVQFLKKADTPFTKVWRFDARTMVWDPEQVEDNVGIPVSYRVTNDTKSGLGETAMWGGKVRVFQEDGHDSTIFLGEDNTGLTPVGEDMLIYIGDSRDIVVTQRKMKDQHVNIRRNNRNQVVLYDTDELIKATIENFKDTPAVLTMVQQIPGEWVMKECTHEYEKTDYQTLEFEITLPAKGKVEFVMEYSRKNVR